MRLYNWEKLIREESKETLQLFIEGIKLENKGYEQRIKENENEIKRYEQFKKDK